MCTSPTNNLHSMAIVVAVTNQKGGVGKTTSAANLAAGLTLLNKDVLLVDLDPQANLTNGLGLRRTEDDEERDSVFELLLDDDVEVEDVVVRRPLQVKGNLPSSLNPLQSGRYDGAHTAEREGSGNLGFDVAPSDLKLSGAEIKLASAFGRERLLSEKLTAAVGKAYDYCLIDCPPSLGLLTVNAFVAAERVIIPVQTEYYALDGVNQIYEAVRTVRKLNRNLDVGGAFATMFDKRRGIHQEARESLASFFEDRFFDAVIRIDTKLSEAPSHGLTIFEHAASSRGAEDYADLAVEIDGQFGGGGGEASPISQNASIEQEAS